MLLVPYTFLAPKEGEELEDCQDSIYPHPTESSDGIFSVSDGTTTSFFPGVWARILTSRFSAEAEKAFTDWPEWLSDAQKAWKSEIEIRARASDASFFTRNDFLSKKPAAATFLGLRIETRVDRVSWRALIVGDSCIFHLTKNEIATFELEKSTQFSNLVKTVESYARDNSYSPTQMGREIHEGDTILLASDAFAKWLLLRNERQMPLWGTVLSLTTNDQFAELIKAARKEAENRLENDDVALAVIRYGDPHEHYKAQQFVPAPSPTPFLSAVPPVPAGIPQVPPPAPSPLDEKESRTVLEATEPPSAKTSRLFILATLLAIATVGLSYRLVRETEIARSAERQLTASSNQSILDNRELSETNLALATLKSQMQSHASEFANENAEIKAKQREFQEIATKNDALEDENRRLKSDLAEAQLLVILAGTNSEIAVPNDFGPLRTAPTQYINGSRPSESP